MTERKYSVAEIDRMRKALRRRAIPLLERSPGQWMSDPYNPTEVREQVECELRTYMLNGTDPEELEQP